MNDLSVSSKAVQQINHFRHIYRQFALHKQNLEGCRRKLMTRDGKWCVRVYGGQTNVAVEIKTKRMWNFDREVSVMAFGYNAKKKICWRLWDRVSLGRRWKQPTGCNEYRLLIFFKNLLSMFWATTSPIFRNTFWLYVQLLVQCTDIAARPMAPVGRNIGALYRKLCIQSKSAPEDGRVCRPKHVERVLKKGSIKINKRN